MSDCSMPPCGYLLTHPNARLTKTELTAFTDGLIATLGGERDGVEHGPGEEGD